MRITNRLSGSHGSLLLLAVPLVLSSTACSGQADPLDDDDGGAVPSGTLAVGTADGGVAFYPPGAVSGTAPVGQLTPSWGPYLPQYLAFDAHGTLYVDAYLDSADAGAVPSAAIFVFAPGSVGSAAPVRTLAGARTGLATPRAMLVDGQGFLYVANASAIRNLADPAQIADGVSAVDVFAPEADGDVAPVRVITSSAASGWQPSGLGMSAQGNLFVSDSTGGPVQEFPSGANGAATPVASFGGSPLFGETTALGVDPSGRILVADWVNNQVDIFGGAMTEDDGGAAMPAVLGGNATMINQPTDLAIDPAGRILVVNAQWGVTIFASGASGDVAPVTVLSSEGGYNLAIVP